MEDRIIGQENLKSSVLKIIGPKFPKFLILVGGKGSGKKSFAKMIGKRLSATTIITETRVDDIREIIELSYKQKTPTLYIIPDADHISLSSKNALLKITEEPPNNSYFIMTLENLDNTLPTLKSRGAVFYMDPYTSEDILEYAKRQGYDLKGSEEIVKNICRVPGEIETIIQYDIREFDKYLDNVVEYIGLVNGANAFKIADKLKYKEEDEGYDILLFMRGLSYKFAKKMWDTLDLKYARAIQLISKYIRDLQVKSINKRWTIEMWILEIRGVLD